MLHKAVVEDNLTRNLRLATAFGVIGGGFPAGFMSVNGNAGTSFAMIAVATLIVWALTGGLTTFISLKILDALGTRSRAYEASQSSRSRFVVITIVLALLCFGIGQFKARSINESDRIQLEKERVAQAQVQASKRALVEKAAAAERVRLSKLTPEQRDAETRNNLIATYNRIPFGITLAELSEQVQNLKCETPPNPKVKLCSTALGKNLEFTFTFYEDSLFNINGRTKHSRPVQASVSCPQAQELFRACAARGGDAFVNCLADMPPTVENCPLPTI